MLSIFSPRFGNCLNDFTVTAVDEILMQNAINNIWLKDNLNKVLAFSIPSGITVCINVLLLLLVTKIFHLNIENYKMALVASTGIINLIIINNISKNSTKIAKILLSICGITFTLSLLIFYKILLLPKYNIYILLMIILYFIIDKYLIKYLKIAYENIILKNK